LCKHALAIKNKPHPTDYLELMFTDHQAKYLAYELTRRCPSDSVEKLAAAVAGAQVDLNPHQVDAALFAFQSPLSKGAILADEVGLGKTIEAGLVISQKWAERKRRMITLPARPPDSLLDLPAPGKLDAFAAARQKAIQRQVSERNARFYEAEAAKLDGWADDLKVGLEREIKEFDRQLKETRRASITALTLEEKLASQKQIKAIEAQRNEKRRSLFEAQDAIDRQRENLITLIEGKLLQETRLEPLFHLPWRMN
jgi:hypothetical protein